jgi:hypothetical protein
MNPVRAWNQFFFARVSARPLGFFRIVFGTLFLCNLGFLAFDLTYWFTGAGLLQGTEAAQAAGPLRPSLLQTIQDPLAVRAFFAVTAVVAVLFTVGWHTRIMGVLLYVLMLQIHHRNVVTNSGADTLVLVMLFYMMLSPCGAALSLDALRARRRRGTVAEPLIVPWAQRLIQLQLCLIYLDTAVLKCNGTSWLNGTALHFVVHNSEVGRPLLTWLADYPVLMNIMSVAALWTELALPFLIWFRATRPWAILAGLGLHAGVLLTVNVPIFGEVMTACYLPFLTVTELDSLLRLANPRNWFSRRKAPTARAVAAAAAGRIDPPALLAGPHLPVPRPVHGPAEQHQAG